MKKLLIMRILIFVQHVVNQLPLLVVQQQLLLNPPIVVE
ncbi:unnamed protein product, partial [Trichobilharzia regenti]